MTALKVTCSDVEMVLSRDKTELTAATASSTLEHAAGCERCSIRLTNAGEQVLTMLAILERAEEEAEAGVNPELEKQRDNVIRYAQAEYLLVAKAAAQFVRDESKTLAGPLPSETLDDAFSHLDRSELRDPVIARLALAQLEAEVALSALIGTGTATLRLSGVLEVGEKTIQPADIANLLRDSTGPAAEKVWLALARCAIEGTVGKPGFPGFAVEKISPEAIRMKAVLAPMPDFNVHVTGSP